ncbi:DUF6093 family protein [uncultured Brevibacterium sp.]|uniref:DUF6093 family protein n=1 Tax=uncultured Brevibacterium sp. TaxID=189678 RepID=UPI0025DDD882|nr:DUF6093 family protein [uncultured Brevibacterium sp.]
MRPEIVVARGRRAAERLMTQQCQIERVGDLVTDKNTGKVTNVRSRVYAGKCKVQSSEVQPVGADTAGLAVTVARLEVHVPVGACQVRPGDIVTVTQSPVDDRFVGKQYRVTLPAPVKAYATADRHQVEEL